MSGIQIFRALPIINGYVQILDNKPADKTAVKAEDFAVPGAKIVSLSLGSGPNTGSKFGAQRFVRLPDGYIS